MRVTIGGPRAGRRRRSPARRRRPGAEPGISRPAGQDHRAVRGRRADRRGGPDHRAEAVGKFGQQFYIENVPGAGGNIGMARPDGAADGYTILFVSSSYTVNPSLYAKAPFDPDRDFAPVTKAAGSPNGLFVHPSIPAKSVKELVELLRANPGKYTFASPGIGTTPHLSSELFKLTFALDFALAPFPARRPRSSRSWAATRRCAFRRFRPRPAAKDGKLRALAVIPPSPLAGVARRPDARGRRQGQEAETMKGWCARRHAEGDRRPAAAAKSPSRALPDVKAQLSAGLRAGREYAGRVWRQIKPRMAKWDKVVKDAKIRIK